jgi:hypothetical protein
LFDPLAWAIGFVLNTTLKKCADALLKRKDLSTKLWKTIEQWAKSLPPELRFVPNALFPELTDGAGGHGDEPAPAATVLGTTLAKGIVPSQQIWFDALLERQKTVRTRLGDEAAAFFRLPESRTASHLEDLATKLERACMEDSTLFQVTVLSRLEGGSVGGSGTAEKLRLHVLQANVEALKYDPSKAVVRFTLSNLTPDLVKVTALQLRILAKNARRSFRLPDVGAPLSEFALLADLRQSESHDLLANTAAQFVLEPQDSDAFSLSVLGAEGWEYQIAIECKAEVLSSARTYAASTGRISVLYPIRTAEGLKRSGKHTS